ncbi:MAG: glycosyltransferase family 39 protein [Chloroflexota bacterium]
MQNTPSISNSTLNKIVIWLWLGLLSAGILSNPMFTYPGRDGGIFLYIGSLILRGKTPYLDVWENKGPLVFYINALGLLVSNGSRWGVWFLEFVFFLAAGWIGYITLKRTMSTIPALVGTFVWIFAAGNVLQGGNFSEEYSLLFSFIALFAFLKSLEQPGNRLFTLLIGISLGLNILLRPNNISMQVAVMGAYFVLALLSRDWRLLLQRVIFTAAGTLFVLLPVIAYFSLRGALSEMINVVLVFNFQYSEGKNLSGILGGLINASLSIGWVLTAVAAAGYVLSLASLFRRDPLKTPVGGVLLVLLIGWPLEAFLSTLSGRNYPHYFIGWAPFAGLFFAYAISVILSRFSQRIEQYAVAVLVVSAMIAVGIKFDIWRDYGTTLVALFSPSKPELAYVDPVAAYIRENTSPGDEVFIWGFRPIINFVSGRDAPVSFLPYPLVHVKSPQADRWADQVYEQFTGDPPVMVINMIDDADRERIPDLNRAVRRQQTIRYKSVVLAPNLKDMLNFIDDNYVLVETVDGCDIYRLKTSRP